MSSYYLESGNAADAQQLLEPALKYDTDNVIAHLNLGDAYRLLGRPADAKREFDWVKKRDPSIQLQEHHLASGFCICSPRIFRESRPGQAADTAIDELNQYKKMKPRVAPAALQDDTDELITRAKTKKGSARCQSGAGKPPMRQLHRQWTQRRLALRPPRPRQPELGPQPRRQGDHPTVRHVCA